MGKVRMRARSEDAREVDLGGGVWGLAPVYAEWRGDRPGDPDVHVTVEVDDRGRPFIAEIRAVSRPGGRGVALADLAQIFTPEQVLTSVLARFAGRDDGTGARALGGRDETEWAEIKGQVSRLRNRPAVPPLADLEFVKNVYLEAAKHGGKPVDAVVAALSDALGKPVSRSTASRRIKAAEREGLLPTTQQGKKRSV